MCVCVYACVDVRLRLPGDGITVVNLLPHGVHAVEAKCDDGHWYDCANRVHHAQSDHLADYGEHKVAAEYKEADKGKEEDP